MNFKTISGSYTHAVTLTASENPVSVSGTINVTSGYALIGPYPVAWTIVNAGYLKSLGTTNAGVGLLDGGTLTNSSYIEGATGIYIAGAPASVTNSGNIFGHVAVGVSLKAGGILTNQPSGYVGGNSAGVIAAANATVVNQGQIAAYGSGSSFGIGFYAGGMITNATAAVISGQFGILGINAAMTVQNAGTILGGTNGIFLAAGGMITNQGGGLITASATTAYTGAIYSLGGAATVVNAGSIGGQTAVALAAGYLNRVVFDPGGTFTGLVDGGNPVGSTVISTLELASGSGSLPGLGSQFVDFGEVQVDPGASWAVAGSGTVTVSAGGTVSLADPSASGIGVVFPSTGGGTLLLPGDAGTVAAPVIGFGNGGTIAFSGLTVTSAFASDGTVSINGGRIELTNVSGVSGPLQHGFDVATGEGYIEAPCFLEGTRLRCPSGDVAIETMRIGDCLTTLQPIGSAPIVWIGSRLVDCSRHPRPERVWPIRIRAHAFGMGRPARDLMVSPNHAIFLNDVLIPARYLINDGSISQVPMRQVRYWHVELDRHSIVLAEGLAAESYLDFNNRSSFDGQAGVVTLYPDFTALAWEAFGCAPLVVTGPALAAARALAGGGPARDARYTGHSR